jgi:3-methyladenine DNA glycosylase AlkD
MNTTNEVMKALKAKGSAQTRKIYARHLGSCEMFGVKVADMKVIAKNIKGRQDIACELYDTGNYDAMYLAGLVADGSQMTKKQLQSWAKKASTTAGALSQYTVPWVATESKHARDLAIKWIDSKTERIASTGWCTYSGIVANRPDDELDFTEIKELLNRVIKEIDNAPNRVKYTMNGFVISVGGYVKPLLKKAKAAAKKLGKVSVDMGDTACKVPVATDYIAKIEKMERIGKKRKMIKC